MNEKTLNLQYCLFVVNERPLCVWDEDLERENLKFINSIDPSYFEYLYQLYSQSLDKQNGPTDRDSQHAALALRAAYSQALETLFALIFAAVQAQWCIPAWINAYKTDELRKLVRKVREEQPIISILGTKALSWSDIYDFLFSGLDMEDEAYGISIKDGFIKTWECFAYDFLDEGFCREYNSIKHGLRIHSGGFKMYVGTVKEHGQRPPQDEMMELTNSDFGSSYLNSEKIEGWSYHSSLRAELHNWNLESLMWGLQMVTTSIKNVQSALKAPRENEPQPQFSHPQSLEDFNRWRRSVSVTEPKITIFPEFIHPFTKEEILSNYESRNYHGAWTIRFAGEEETK